MSRAGEPQPATLPGALHDAVPLAEVCARPGCSRELRPDQIRIGTVYHSRHCASLAKVNRPASVPGIVGPPASMACYCGRRFTAGSGWGMFHSRACGEAFIGARYFDLGDYQRRRHERAA